MRQTTFLSLSVKPWILSVFFHLGFFGFFVLAGRHHTPAWNPVELDLSTQSHGTILQSQLTLDGEWRKPLSPPSVPLKEETKPAVRTDPAPGATGLTSGQGAGAAPSTTPMGQLVRYINEVKPEFPETANRADITGEVILQVDIDATGAVKKVSVIQGLGHGCDEAAIAALMRSTIAPVYDGQRPVPVKGLFAPYQFNLKD